MPPWAAGLGNRHLIMQTCSCRSAPGRPVPSLAAGLRGGGLSERPESPRAMLDNPETSDGQRSCGIRSGPSGKVKLRQRVHPRVYAVAVPPTLAPALLAQPLGDTVGSSPSSTDYHVGLRLDWRPDVPCDSRQRSGAPIQPAVLVRSWARNRRLNTLQAPSCPRLPLRVGPAGAHAGCSQPSTTSDGLSESAPAVKALAPSSTQLAQPWAAGLGNRHLIMQTCSCRSAPGRPVPSPAAGLAVSASGQHHCGLRGVSRRHRMVSAAVVYAAGHPGKSSSGSESIRGSKPWRPPPPPTGGLPCWHSPLGTLWAAHLQAPTTT
jgi:hypothetical protein